MISIWIWTENEYTKKMHERAIKTHLSGIAAHACMSVCVCVFARIDVIDDIIHSIRNHKTYKCIDNEGQRRVGLLYAISVSLCILCRNNENLWPYLSYVCWTRYRQRCLTIIRIQTTSDVDIKKNREKKLRWRTPHHTDSWKICTQFIYPIRIKMKYNQTNE